MPFRFRGAPRAHRDKTSDAMRDLVVSPAMGVSTLEPGVVWAREELRRSWTWYMEATDTSRRCGVCRRARGFVSRILTHTEVR